MTVFWEGKSIQEAASRALMNSTSLVLGLSCWVGAGDAT